MPDMFCPTSSTPREKKGVYCKKKGYSGIGYTVLLLIMRTQSIKADTVCAGFCNHWRIWKCLEEEDHRWADLQDTPG